MVIGGHVHLAEPVGKGELGLEPGLGQPLEQCESIPTTDEDIEVLGAAHPTRVVPERVPAAHEERSPQTVQEPEGILMTVKARPRVLPLEAAVWSHAG